MNEKILGLKIKQLRSEYSLKIGKKFTQENLAKKLEISRGYLSDIESGRTKPSEDLLRKIAEACDTDYLTLADDNISVGYYVNYKILKFLRARKRITQAELSRIMGFDSKTVFSKIENLQKVVSAKLLTELSFFFQVSEEFLISSAPYAIESKTKCPICKTEYYPSDDDNYFDHEATHKNFVQCGIDNIYIEFSKRDDVKRRCENIIFSDNSSLLDQYNSSIEYFQCYYSRSISSTEFSPNHVNFNEYVSMLLNQKSGVCDNFPKSLLDLLIKQFGKIDGIPDGESYAPLKKIATKITLEQSNLLDKFNYLDSKGKHTVNTVLDVEYTRCKNELNYVNDNSKENEEYTLAAHDDDLNSEIARASLDKAKEIFKQMDEE